MWQRLWKTFRIAVVVVGGTLGFFVVIEILRAYQVLRELHPTVGAVFAWVLVLGLLGLAGWYAATAYRRPRVLNRPAGVDPETAQGRPLRAYARYQVRLMRRLELNPSLPALQRESVIRHRARLREALAAGSDAADLVRCVRNAETGAIQSSLDPLDALARAEVARGVRDVMLVVTLSPWRSADLLVVLYRNLRMVLHLSEIYNTRPPLREQALILGDVFVVMATVNIMNYGSNLLQNLTVSLPVLGRFADDIAQGVGAGLMTSVTGHAAMERCRAYGRWDSVEAENAIRRQLRDFLADVKGVAVTEIVQRIRQPVEAQLPEAARKPGLQRQIREGITAAIDQTTAIMDSMLARPAAAVRVAPAAEIAGPSPLRIWMEGIIEEAESAWKRLLRACRRSDRVTPHRGLPH